MCTDVGVMHLHVEGSIVLLGVDVLGAVQPEELSSYATQYGDRFIKCSSCEIKAKSATDDEQALHNLVTRTLSQCRDDRLDSASRAA